VAHINIFMVKAELTKPIERRLRKIFFRAIFWEMSLYMISAFAGYFSFVDETKHMIIDRPDLPGYKDYLMLVGRIGTMMHVLVSVVIIISPCRKQIIAFIGVKRKSKTWEHFFLTGFIYASSAVVAYEFPDVISVFSLIGGTGGVIVAVLFPMWIYV